MGSYDKAIESYKKTLTMAASVAASVMLVRGVINEFVPPEVWNFLFSGLNQLRSRVSSQHTIVIEENEGFCTNQVFDAVRTYLASRINTDMQRIRVSRLDESKNIMVSMEAGEEMIDKFDGTEFKWQVVCRESTASSSMNNNNFRQLEMRSYELHFHKDYKDKALNKYLPFILQKAKEINEQERTLKIYMNEGDIWCPVDLHHPSTFDTLAMDSELKQSLMDDLERFVKRRDYYKRIGKAWKRGYLLYGPPGTGKSSLVAAIANYLKFDVYDLELNEVRWNSTLRRLLIGMSNRSILVIEDIDCTIELQQRDDNYYAGGDDEKITLSGLLNFVDGLWSTSGEERIIVFTTNYKERLDPALTRPGRMDMHIHMGYCSTCGFQVLVRNYHSIEDHAMFPEIDGLLKEVEVTPAEVAEVLKKSDITDVALEGLVGFLKGKKERATEGEKEGENSGEEKDLLELEAGGSIIMTPTTTSETED
ncbi:P-loop containing nucleoside triphosphate hydrolases superfamily protein [Rhynchospora pubera]|uniref:P-loop containing nucleoside triphosphate hydrolases superfamily protein n=1 Tax=Rhynchospora pubera TaxID=906938 RepID=A0AAV8FZ56_9POAL|nr:P-loop containing nucleoside triphosphate hydrolases superfamily protein [Rhynchospora pubera]